MLRSHSFPTSVTRCNLLHFFLVHLVHLLNRPSQIYKCCIRDTDPNYPKNSRQAHIFPLAFIEQLRLVIYDPIVGRGSYRQITDRERIRQTGRESDRQGENQTDRQTPSPSDTVRHPVRHSLVFLTNSAVAVSEYPETTGENQRQGRLGDRKRLGDRIRIRRQSASEKEQFGAIT
ncbi:uncharacterized protein YALI1_E21106g [Yarrowia lipolytica]|uniref:Uncharacterized protein n=1 Tax=Yarrowia lipolytica TaxID=4952 RepID=A0A1D8NIW8_YARLL|nr:hypothetical protein YALI1_E21106g [Yarrowia lipolytica]